MAGRAAGLVDPGLGGPENPAADAVAGVVFLGILSTETIIEIHNEKSDTPAGDAKPVPQGVKDSSRGAVPGTGKKAGNANTATVNGVKAGPPRVGAPIKKSDAPKEAARGGHLGGVVGSKTQAGKMQGRADIGHRGGPDHTHPTEQQGKGHFWQRW